VFFDLFPFYIIFNRNLEILSLGESLRQAVKNAIGELIKDVFTMVRPNVSFTWDEVRIKRIKH
jgi:guanylate cyclase